MTNELVGICDECGKSIYEEDDTEYPWWCNECCEQAFKEFLKRFEEVKQ